MAPIDWTQLMALDVGQLQEDTSLSDQMYEVLAEFDPGAETDVKRLIKLFQVSQAIMVIKGVAAEIVEEQLSEQAVVEGRNTAKKDQEIMDLNEQIVVLKRELADQRRYGGGSDYATKDLRDELREVEDHLASAQRDLVSRENQLAEQKRLCEDYMKRAADAERLVKELRDDNDRLRDEARDLNRQLEAQRDQLVNTKAGGQETRNQMTELRKKLNEALDENIMWRQQLSKKEEEIEHYEKQMMDGQMEIEKTLQDYLKLKAVVESSDAAIDSLQRENAALKSQIEDLLGQLGTKADADDEIMAHVNVKVEEWKGILADKDMQILDLRQQIMRLRDDLNVANMDTDRKSVAMLTKALDEKEKNIEILTKKLNEAVADLQHNQELLKDVHSKVLNTGRDPKNQQLAVAQLQSTIVEHEAQMKDMEDRLQAAEADAQDKEKQLNDLLVRMSQYENGIYGLPEAVAEIKSLKNQIKLRDQSIEDHVKSINRCEEQINVLYDEVEELRLRLGLDPREPINVEELRHNKLMHINQDRALNRVLTKEIERLEEERINLKQKIRDLVQTSASKVPDSVLEDIAIDVRRSDVARDRTVNAKTDDISRKYKQLLMEHERSAKALDGLNEEATGLKVKNNELEAENRTLERALREIREQLSTGARPGTEPLQCAALDKYLEMVNTRNVVGRYDMAVVMKAQIDNLTGRNDELRRELRDVRFEAAKAQENFNKANAKAESLESEVKSLRDAGATGGWFQSMPLPEGLAATSSEIIAGLNEHLVVALQELSLREKMIEKMETSLETYQRKFAIIRHQQGLIYQEYGEEKKKFEIEVKRLRDELSEVQGKKQEDDAKIKEFNRLLDTLAQDEAEVRRRLVEMTRTITVLRVNEKILTRKYTISQQVETSLRQENNRLKKDVMAIETAVTERIGYLQRYKDMASFKMAALQRALDDSVPASELELANKQFTDLTEKYRDKLESTKSLIAFKEEATGYQSEVKRLQDENNTLTKELEIEKEKLHTLEAAFERMRKQGTAKPQDLQDNDLMSLAHRLTTLEMKELNERQRAEHASRMYEQQKGILRQLEDRNFELERKFAELTRINLDMQKVDRELRDELANCIPKSVSDADRKKIADLEAVEARLRNEVSKLKEVAEIATSQVQTLQTQHESHDKELMSLRQQLVDIQAQSDEKTVIGKLHRHIVQMQFSEGTAVRKLDEARKKITKLEAQLLRTEQVVDDKDRTVYHHRVESRNKIRHLRHTIQDLRRKFTGAIPLSEQEKFAELMTKLQENQKTVEEDLKKTNEERSKVEDKLAEVELKNRGLEELMSTIRDRHGAEKVARWQAKMETVNLENVRLKREIEKLKDKIKFLEAIVRKHEAEVIMLEEEKVRMKRDFETNEVEWEQREVELERTIAQLEKQQSEIAGAASQFEEAVGRMPDSALPVAHQLEQAVTTIKRNVKLILDSKAQSELYKKKMEEIEAKLREKERELLNRDRVITELRLRLPATADRDAVFDKVTGEKATPRDEDYEASQAIRVATNTVSSLQARIAQKEESLARYQKLLQDARDEMTAAAARHDEELRAMQRQLHEKNEIAFKKYKLAIKESVNQPDKPLPTSEQLKRLNELEDIVSEQDNALAALRDKLSAERLENQRLKTRLEDVQRQQADEREMMKQQSRDEVSRVEMEKEAVNEMVAELRKQLRETEQELADQKEANARAPSQTIKGLVEKLKNQLALKEKQHQALSKALLDLRADLVNQAQSDVLVNAERAAAEVNVQQIVSQKTKELQDRVEKLDENSQKLKSDLRKLKDRDASNTAELDQLRDELARKDTLTRKLKDEKSSLIAEIDELKSKVQRMGTINKQRSESEAYHQEMEDLRRKNQSLVRELERAKMQAEKPFEQQPLTQRDEALSKWEEGKKLQKKIDSLKVQLKDKETELEKLAKTNDMLRQALDRANNEKEKLEARTHGGAGVGSTAPPQPAAHSAGKASGAMPQTHETQDLKKRIHELEDEVASLRRQLVVGRDVLLEEAQLQNKFLTEKVENLERALAQVAGRSSGNMQRDRGIEYRELAQREDELQKRVIKLSEENMELRFEVEQANRDIPRLKERNEDLQKYIDILKAEKQQMELMSRSRDSFSSLLGSPSGGLRRIGESGRTPEQLEKAVAVLKKIVEKTRAENERLKAMPSFVSADQLSNLQTENADLKGQLEELRQKMGATLSERYSAQQKSTAKIMADYEKLRKDLTKEKETSEKLRLRVRELELSAEQRGAGAGAALDRDASEVGGRKSRLDATGSDQTSGGDAKAWKLKARLSEEKIKELEDDLDKKTKQLNDMKALLRDSAERERQLMHEKADLEEKIAILQRLPPGAKGSDSELMKEYQLTRLQNERLENEKKELLHELQTLRRKPGSTGTDVSDEELIMKLRAYDRLTAENVDLTTKTKLLQRDNDRLNAEMDKLKKELANFGPEFFEEIEDLKFRCHEATEKCRRYEEQLMKLSKQFGVSVNIQPSAR